MSIEKFHARVWNFELWQITELKDICLEQLFDFVKSDKGFELHGKDLPQQNIR